MKRSFKFRIYFTISQENELSNILYFCRLLYNSALQERKEYYKKYAKGIFYVKQASYLKEIRQTFPEETKNIYSQTLQGVLKQLDIAFKNFFRRVKNGETPGYPRFKNKDRFKSIVFPQVIPDLSHGVIRIVGNKLNIYGIKGILKSSSIENYWALRNNAGS